MRTGSILCALVGLTTMLPLASCKQGAYDANTSAESSDDDDDTTNQLAANAVFCPEAQQRLAPEDCDTVTEIAERAKAGTAAFNAPAAMKRGETKTVYLILSRTPPPVTDVAMADNAMADLNDAVAIDTGTDDNDAAADNQAASDNGLVPESIHKHVHLAKPELPPPPAPTTPTPHEQAASLPGTTSDLTPKVGRFMKAKLEGDGIDIQPAGYVAQQVPEDGNATWQWQITPREKGDHQLTLSTMVEGVTSAGQHVPLTSTTNFYPVKVRVTWTDEIWDFADGFPLDAKRIAGVITGIGVILGAFFGLRKIIRNRNKDDKKSGSGDDAAT